MKNVIPQNSILEISPTNIRYTHKSEEINKTFLLSKDKIKNNLLKMDFSTCDFFNKENIFNNIKIAPISFIFFKLFAQKTKVPHPQIITNTYLEVFCKKNGNKYEFKENFIVEKQIQFEYNDLFKYVCNKYSGFISVLFLLIGLYKINADLEILYEYKNEILYNINLSIVYKDNLFLLTSSKNINDVKSNKTYIEQLKKEYKNVNILSIFSNEKKYLDKTNQIVHFNDKYDEYIYNQIINIEKQPKIKKDNYNESILDYEKQPFYIKGINRDFF